ncbi:MAG: PDZ domain-containing protein [Gemmatimonadales bacterium]
MIHARAVALVVLAAVATGGRAEAQGRDVRVPGAKSSPIANVKYVVTFKATNGIERALDVAMTFTTGAQEPVLLSLPVWTPGSYEVSNYARFVSRFAATSRGTPLRWDKYDPSTWRIFAAGAGEVTVSFRYRADSLDNAFAFAREEFALLNGTNLFLYPAGRSLDFASTVTVETEDSWHVATGMTQVGPRTFGAPTYHELVDHPFFVGRFDEDSALVGGVWFRLSTYPVGSVNAPRRAKLLDQIARAVPKEMAVMRDLPWKRYEVMQIADPDFGGMSALEHENSNVAIVGPTLLDEPFVPSVYAHEIFHAFNVKRLRPSEMWPYRYDVAQPTPWLWVSEGITDYYADLALVRGAVTNEAAFLATTQGKIAHVDQTAPIALEDASLQAWLHMADGTSDIYYDKGSLAGLALDIMIRDASDNAASLDDVMRELYAAAYRNGRGFTADEWWRAVSRSARRTTFREFQEKYVDGREPFAWSTWLPKAGWRVRSDTIREPRLGVQIGQDTTGVRVMFVDPSGVAAAAGVEPGDVITAVGGVSTTDPSWQSWRQKYASQEGAPLSISLLRGGKPMRLTATVKLIPVITERLEVDANPSEKAKRIRDGILKGETTPVPRR